MSSELERARQQLLDMMADWPKMGGFRVAEFERLVREETKEACAQIADKYYAQFIDVAGDIGAEIRALSQEAKK